MLRRKMIIWMAIGLSLCAIGVIIFKYDPYQVGFLIKALFYGAWAVIVLGILDLFLSKE